MEASILPDPNTTIPLTVRLKTSNTVHNTADTVHRTINTAAVDLLAVVLWVQYFYISGLF